VASRWRNRVASLLPRRSGWRMRTRALSPEWQGFVVDAVANEDRYHAAVRRLDKGPLRDRLEAIGDEVATAVEETYRVAAAGQDLADARAGIDVGAIIAELGGPPRPGADARRRQLEIAKRIDQRLSATERRLAALDARLDEVVTRTLELGATQQTDAIAMIGSAVDGVIEELHSLSAGLAELPPVPADLTDLPPLPPAATTSLPAPLTEPVEPAPPTLPPYDGPMPDDPDDDLAPGPDPSYLSEVDPEDGAPGSRLPPPGLP
jgi:hypothetical protein